MKRGWLALALLAGMVALALWHTRCVDALAGELTAALEGAEARAEAGDWDGADRLTREARDRWDRAGTRLHITMDHQVLDEISAGFAETAELLAARERGEYAAANARLVERLELLGEMERPSLSNLL